MTNSIIFGGGCFWCLEAVFQRVKGVESVVSGYAGGETIDPTYEQVCSGNTGHAEVIKVDFDTSVISLEEILDIFWHLHDPTTLNKQGADTGTQYRSIILYSNLDQEKVIRKVLNDVKIDWKDPIVTETLPLEVFYKAEDYHQNYFNQHKNQGYCSIVINPKIKKLREKYIEKTV